MCKPGQVWRYLIGFLLFPICARSQNATDISANRTDYSKDTATINALIAQAKSYRHKVPDSGIACFQQATILSRQINYTDGIARALTGLGLFHMDKGEYNKSYAYYRLAEPFCKMSTFKNGALIALLYNNMAALYGNRGISDSAIYFYNRSLAEMERRKITDTTLLLLIYSNLGGRLASDDQAAQAEFYLKKGQALATEVGNNTMLAKFYVDLAALNGVLKKPLQTREYAYKALELFKKVKDPASELIAYCQLGNSYLDEHQPAQALFYYQKALHDNVKASKTQQNVAVRGIGACYYAMKQYTLAEKYYLDALEVAKSEGLIKGMTDCYAALVNIYTARADYKKALEYNTALSSLKDSTSNGERTKNVTQLEVKYRSAEKDKELAQRQLLLQQKETLIRQKNRLITTISIGAALLMALFGTLYRNYKHRKNIQFIRLDKEREIGQLKAIMEGEEKERTRIARELHDGIMVQFSSAQMNLSALIEKNGLAHGEEMEQILEQLENATKELRKSAHNLMPDMLLHEGLAEATHYFCKSLQSSAGINIEFQLIGTIPEISPEYQLMLYRIIQELLQNIVKHARANEALVQISSHPDMISISVEDNGAGFDRNTINGKSSMGIKGIESRIHSLSGNISFTSAPQKGTSVYIELDIEKLIESSTSKNGNYSSYN